VLQTTREKRQGMFDDVTNKNLFLDFGAFLQFKRSFGMETSFRRFKNSQYIQVAREGKKSLLPIVVINSLPTKKKLLS
jgi:hypothetical protein